MTIDVLLSTYNGARFIDAQIESIFNQTYKDIRLIVRDDGSKDETPQKLLQWKERYPDQIVLYLEENVGVVESFNRLVGYSKAPFLAFCDQDDVWMAHKLETCFSFLDKDKPSLVHSDLKVVDSNLLEIHPSFWGYSYLSGDPKYAKLPRLLIQNVVTGCTTLFNRELAELAYPIPKGVVMHDWWVALVASCFGTLHSCKEPLILYRQHGNNTVGAVPFSIFKTSSKMYKMLKHEKQKVVQAKEFIKRFRSDLSPKMVELLTAFIFLRDTYGLSRVLTIIKYKFYKIGWQRNLLHFIRLKRNIFLKK